MFTPGAGALRVISGLLFLWAAASTLACFVLLANQNLGNSLPRTSDFSVTSLRSKLSSDIFDSPTFGNVTAAEAGLYGISRRAAIESDASSEGEGEDEVAFARTSFTGNRGESDEEGSKANHGDDGDSSSEAEDDPGRSRSRRRQAAADSEDAGSGGTNGVDEERAFAMQSSKKGDEVEDLLAGVQKTLVSELTEQTSSKSTSRVGRARPVPLSSCDTFTSPDRKPHDPWVSMKWVLPPAMCKVQGMAIEELDARYNFRRGFALGFTDDEEDRTHLLPYLRASHDPSLQERRRRVLIDLGANKFESSVQWFLNFYPLDFTEMHVFEEHRGLFTVPGRSSLSRGLLQAYEDNSEDSRQEEQGTQSLRTGRNARTRRRQQYTSSREGSSTRRKRTHQQLPVEELPVEDSGLPKHLDTSSRSRPVGAGPWPLPQWALDRITVHDRAVSQFDSRREVNITRFLVEELGLTRRDAVVLKMDIEYNEWFILQDWVKDLEMPYIIDDLFVEFHYSHYSMKGQGWNVFQKKRTQVGSLTGTEVGQRFSVDTATVQTLNPGMHYSESIPGLSQLCIEEYKGDTSFVDCAEFHLVEKGETCESVRQTNNLTDAEILYINPGQYCYSFAAGTAVSV